MFETVLLEAAVGLNFVLLRSSSQVAGLTLAPEGVPRPREPRRRLKDVICST